MRRLTPYALLAVLVLGIGLGIGLGLAGAPSGSSDYPRVRVRVIEAFNSLYKEMRFGNGSPEVKITSGSSEVSPKVSKEEAVAIVQEMCGVGTARILGVSAVKAWLGRSRPVLEWAIAFDPPGKHELLRSGLSGTSSPTPGNWYIGLVNMQRNTRPFCTEGYSTKLPVLPVFDSRLHG